MYTFRYESSMDSEQLGRLTDLNHITSIKGNRGEEIVKIFDELGLIREIGNTYQSIEHLITKWKDTPNYKDLCTIYKNNELIYWLPRIEQMILCDFIERHGIPEFGYIAGTLSPFGPSQTQGMMSSSVFPGYKMWIESKNKETKENQI